MTTSRLILALCLTLSVAGAAAAQEAASSSEFGRAFGGEIDLGFKSPSRISGSLSLLTGNHGRGYGATFGGTLLKDRVWFFGSAEQVRTPLFQTTVNAVGDRNVLTGAFRVGRDTIIPPAASTPMLTAPSSFLSLHYTGTVSNNMSFSATVSRRSSGLEIH